MKPRFLVATWLFLLAAPGAQARPKPLAITRSGVLSEGVRPTFSFRARRGQRIRASINSTTGGFYPMFFITSPSGVELLQYKQTSYSARLPETGRYQVRVGVNFMATQTTRGNYRMKLRVR
jgi:hypothetical protein